jgi:lipopolysaccharide transport system ATP-binding protein
MAAVKNLCKTGIVLENGQISFSGTSEESVNFYLENSFKLAVLPLNERLDRKGNKKLMVTDIYIENQELSKVGEVNSGDRYNIVFDYILNDIIDPKQLTIVVQFKNDNDEIFTTIATDELGIIFSEVPKNGKIKIIIPKLQFREGTYTMNYMISEKLAFNTPHVTLDYLQDAFVLNVIRGDYWNSGVLNRPRGFIQESTIQIV